MARHVSAVLPAPCPRGRDVQVDQWSQVVHEIIRSSHISCLVAVNALHRGAERPLPARSLPNLGLSVHGRLPPPATVRCRAALFERPVSGSLICLPTTRTRPWGDIRGA